MARGRGGRFLRLTAGLVVAVAMPEVGLYPEPAAAQPADVRVLTLRGVAEEMYRYMPQPALTLSDVFRYRIVSEPDAPPPPPVR